MLKAFYRYIVLKGKIGFHVFVAKLYAEEELIKRSHFFLNVVRVTGRIKFTRNPMSPNNAHK